MSGGLATLATRYLRIGASPELVKLFLRDTWNIDVILKVHHLFDDGELYKLMLKAYFDDQGRAEFHERTIQRIDKFLRRKDRLLIRRMLLLATNGVPIPPLREIGRIATVVEVTTS